MKLTLILLLLVLTVNGCSQMTIQRVSNLVGRKQSDTTGQFKKNTFSPIRNKLFEKYPNLFSGSTDTLFFMEKYNTEEATYFGMIWSKEDTVNYSYFADEMMLSEKQFFTAKAINLVSGWDVAALRKEELKYPTSDRDVHVARSIMAGRKCLIDTLQIKDLIFDR